MSEDKQSLATAILAVKNAIEALSEFDISTKEFNHTLDQLESMLDPWYIAKQALLHLENGEYKVREIAKYVRYLEQELANRKPLWIVLPVDADDSLHYRPNGGLMEYVFPTEEAAEKHRQQAVNPDEYRIRTLWGK